MKDCHGRTVHVLSAYSWMETPRDEWIEISLRGRPVYRMPMPPSPVSSKRNVQYWSELGMTFPGLYFAFVGDVIVYVGKSNDVLARIATHNKISGHELVSWMEIDESLLTTWEAFYIWFFDPERNAGARNKKRTVISEADQLFHENMAAMRWTAFIESKGIENKKIEPWVPYAFPIEMAEVTP